jgi:non-specific serine/threonine protein kinase/serine/threonine-protein kinase
MQDDWGRFSLLMDAVLEAAPQERRALIDAQTGDDPAMRAAALRFLAGLEAAGTGFMRTGGAVGATTQAPLSPGDRIGAWRIDGLIGSGGMGEVYRASRADGGFSQDAALKRARAPMDADRILFERERQTLADLDHPGIVRILDGGADPEGRLWMAMELVDGATIDRWAADRGLDIAGRVRLVIAAADALSRAHARLVLHRDLKPSNILVDGSGQVRLIDFGIARRLGADRPADEAGAGPISHGYAAPEIVAGEAVGPAADVYGLSCVLHDLLAGPLTPSGRGLAGVLADAPARALLTRAGLLPELRAGASDALIGDLAAILARAGEADPALRYQTMDAFADDLRLALTGHGVRARAAEPGYRTGRWLRRFRLPIGAAAAAVLSLTGGLGFSLWQAGEARAARDAAVVEADRTEAVRQSLFLILGESTEAAGPEGTRKDVLDRAAARLRRDFVREPARYAPILKALGELYFHSNDYPGATGLLEPVAALPLSGGARNGVAPEVIAEAKIDLAQVYLRTGDAQAARTLLADAHGFWASDPARWRTDLIDSRLTEAQILRDLDKAPDKAAALLRAALAERIAVSGPANRDVAIFQNNLGNILSATGDHDGAAQAFTAARATWIAIGADETPDAMNTLNNLAATQVLAGRPQAAAPMFAEAVRLRRELFGPSAALAALINNHAKALLLAGQAGEALPLAREAAAMAARFAGEGSMLHAASAAGHSEALIAAGDVAEGAAVARAAWAQAQAASGPDAPPATVALIAHARAVAASGDADAARSLLARAEAGVAAIGPAGARLATSVADIRTRYGLE